MAPDLPGDSQGFADLSQKSRICPMFEIKKPR
jgi:hypothetical protein